MMGLGLGRKGSMRQPENTKQHKITFVLFFYRAAFAWHSGGGDAPIPFSGCLYRLAICVVCHYWATPYPPISK